MSTLDTTWTIIAALVVIDLAGLQLAAVSIRIDLPVALGFCVALATAFVYTVIRPNRKIATLASACAQLLAFTAAGAVLSYLTVASNLPLVDRNLAAADAALGLDWLALFNWVDASPVVDRIFTAAYYSSMMQIAVLLIWLNVLSRFERMREFVQLFVLTLLFIIPISWIFPAEGAWSHYGVVNEADAYHLADFSALRAGRILDFPLSQANGLITFPSFHATLALLLIYASRGIRILFPLSLAMNLVMIAATPTVGGHYFIDIIAGALVLPLAIAVNRLLQDYRPARTFDGASEPNVTPPTGDIAHTVALIMRTATAHAGAPARPSRSPHEQSDMRD